MKIVMGIIGGLVLLAFAIVIVGYMLPRAHRAQRNATFKASPERIFQLIAGPQNWRPDVKSFVVISGSGVGQRVREITQDGETMTYEVVRFEPSTLLVRRIADKNLPFAGDWTYQIEPRDGQSVVTITENGEIYNPVFRFVSKFVIGQTKTIDTYLHSLGRELGEPVTIR